MLLEMGDEKRIKELVASDRYWWEVKRDGARAIINTETIKGEGNKRGYRIVGRSGEDLSSKFPELAAVAKSLPKNSQIDGELFVPANSKDKSKPTTSSRTNSNDSERRAKLAPATFCAFDVTAWDGLLVTALPIEQRRDILNRLPRCENLEVVKFLKDPLAEWERIKRDGDEGLVAKLKGSPYVFKRSDMWLKCKNWISWDFKITGYTSEKREISALALEGGYKVNFGVRGERYAHYLKAFKKTGKTFRLNDKSTAFEIEPGFTAEVRYIHRSDSGIRFPVIGQIEDANGVKT